jgi:hypothetical protein
MDCCGNDTCQYKVQNERPEDFHPTLMACASGNILGRVKKMRRAMINPGTTQIAAERMGPPRPSISRCDFRRAVAILPAVACDVNSRMGLIRSRETGK